MSTRENRRKRKRARGVWLAPLGVVGVGFLMSGCSSPTVGQLGPCPTPSEITPLSQENLDWFDEQAAQTCVEDAQLIWRVIARDGEYFAVTLDYSPQRINVAIDKSVVTEISVG